MKRDELSATKRVFPASVIEVRVDIFTTFVLKCSVDATVGTDLQLSKDPLRVKRCFSTIHKYEVKWVRPWTPSALIKICSNGPVCQSAPGIHRSVSWMEDKLCQHFTQTGPPRWSAGREQDRVTELEETGPNERETKRKKRGIRAEE